MDTAQAAHSAVIASAICNPKAEADIRDRAVYQAIQKQSVAGVNIQLSVPCQVIIFIFPMVVVAGR
jgi:hypothetical protein